VDPTETDALAETIALLEATLEATHDGILVLDLDRNVVQYNRRFLRMFGFTAEQLKPAAVAGTLSALSDQLENADLLLWKNERFWQDPGIEVIDTLHFKDGRVFERFVAPRRVRDRVVGVVASYHDISHAVRTEQSLEQHRALLERAQQVAHIGSWVAELDGSDGLHWSAETHRILGVAPDASSTRSRAMVEFVHRDDREALRRASAEAIRSRSSYDIEHRIVRADGTVRWVHTRADVVLDDEGRPIRMVGTLQDITERRELEERLRQSQKLEAIGRLAGGVAHDLNNALTAIAGYTELALEALVADHPARPDVLEIRRATERAESVTRQLLAFSRKQMLEPREFQFADSVANLSRMLERLLGDNIELKTSIAPDVSTIYGDPGQLEQAIINLALNARDAMPDGGRLTLALTMTDIDPAFARAHKPMTPGRYVELSVADTGIGMDAETQTHVFEPFFTTKEVGKGTGLGLPMVYGTVKQSGGFIFLESEVGKGTTFRLYFPPSARQRQRLSDHSPVASPSQRTILVAEDEDSVRNLIVAALRAEPYRILQAASAAEAARVAAEAGQVDLLVSDANLSGQDGVALAETLVASHPGLRVIVIADRVLTQPSMAVALLPKPFTPSDVRQKVDDLLGGGRTSGR
jgi:PAS domain S-box-containing protein